MRYGADETKGIPFQVKILIKNLSSGLFLDREGGWTGKADKVRDFGTPAAARDFCNEHRCYHGTATVIRFRLPRHDMELRVETSDGARGKAENEDAANARSCPVITA